MRKSLRSYDFDGASYSWMNFAGIIVHFTSIPLSEAKNKLNNRIQS